MVWSNMDLIGYPDFKSTLPVVYNCIAGSAGDFLWAANVKIVDITHFYCDLFWYSDLKDQNVFMN
jgi:hypothetical protein